MTRKEKEQVNKIEGFGYVVLRIIEVEGYKCAVINEDVRGYGEYCVEVIPFNEDKIYPRQYAVLEWSFIGNHLIK